MSEVSVWVRDKDELYRIFEKRMLQLGINPEDILVFEKDEEEEFYHRETGKFLGKIVKSKVKGYWGLIMAWKV